jgi:peptidoglycan/xylan/chitin deacetylase (PgdA/CDA1 family)
MTAASQDNSTIVHLLFHGVGVPAAGVRADDEAYFVSRDLLLAVLDELRDDPRREVSFDDGYDSDINVALPALLERGMSARFFPLAGQLGQRGRVDADALRELTRAGMAVGSHGMRHRSWRGMNPGVRREELVEARRILSAAAGAPIDAAACPFGDYDRSALTALRDQGYGTVYTSDRRRARVGAWLQPRYTVRRGDTLQTVRQQILAEPQVTRRARDVVAARLKAWR